VGAAFRYSGRSSFLILQNTGRIDGMRRYMVMEVNSHEKGSQLLQLFARHNRALRAYSRTILPSVDPIDDVMQEASIVIWEKQDQLRHSDEFLSWAKTIVRNISFRYGGNPSGRFS
jgi:hypothetical protein